MGKGRRMDALTGRVVRHARLLIAIVLSLCILLAFSIVAPPAQAAAPANYKGWGTAMYPQGENVPMGLTRVEAWKWSPRGWSRASFEFGAPVWLHPYGGSWHWAYSRGSWYAIHSNAVGGWRCERGAAGISINSGRALPVRRYNASNSEVLGYVTGTVNFDCMSQFPDSASNPNLARCMAIGCGPDRFYLVTVRPVPRCLIVAPHCAMPEPIGGYPVKRGYIQIPESFDDGAMYME